MNMLLTKSDLDQIHRDATIPITDANALEVALKLHGHVMALLNNTARLEDQIAALNPPETSPG